MLLDTLMRRFTIRFRMLGAIAVVVLALGSMGAIGVAAQLYSSAITTDLVKRNVTSLAEVARMQQAMSNQNPNDKANETLTTLIADLQRATETEQKK